jgi:hypothetical protein
MREVYHILIRVQQVGGICCAGRVREPRRSMGVPGASPARGAAPQGPCVPAVGWHRGRRRLAPPPGCRSSERSEATAAGSGGRGQQKPATAPLPHSEAVKWGRGATPPVTERQSEVFEL